MNSTSSLPLSLSLSLHSPSRWLTHWLYVWCTVCGARYVVCGWSCCAACNNPKTKNFHRLVRYVVGLLGQQAQPTSAVMEDTTTTLLNGLYLVRVFVKHFIETMDGKELAEQLQGSNSDKGEGAHTHDTPQIFVCVVCVLLRVLCSRFACRVS